jgi:simple sugar transport system permease protein
MTTVETAPPRDPRSLRVWFRRNVQILSIAAILLILLGFFSVFANAFMTPENFVNIGRQIAPTVIVAVAMTFVITTGQIDLSVGSILALSASTIAIVAESNAWIVALSMALLIGVMVGAISGYFSAYQALPSFIVTLAALTAVRGVALYITQGYSTSIDDPRILFLGQGQFLGIYMPTWIALGVAIVGIYVFNMTRFGRYVTAVGSNAEAIRRAGVDIRRIKMAVLMLTGIAGAVAGILIAARLASGSSNSGVAFELEVITAVVLGGTSLMGGRGTVFGSVLGALVLGVLANGLVLMRVDVYWVPIVQGIILLGAILANAKLLGRFMRGR